MERTQAIWNSANFDRPKREMLKGAIKTCDSDDLQRWPSLESDLLWALHQIDSLEDARNTALHSPLLSFVSKQFNGSIVIPNLIHRNPRALRLTEKDLLTEFRWCRDSCMVLRRYLDDALLTIAKHRGAEKLETPWPKRPSLPNRGQRKIRQTRPRRARPE
jgi:hypothetical protein